MSSLRQCFLAVFTEPAAQPAPPAYGAQSLLGGDTYICRGHHHEVVAMSDHRGRGRDEALSLPDDQRDLGTLRQPQLRDLDPAHLRALWHPHSEHVGI